MLIDGALKNRKFIGIWKVTDRSRQLVHTVEAGVDTTGSSNVPTPTPNFLAWIWALIWSSVGTVHTPLEVGFMQIVAYRAPSPSPCCMPAIAWPAMPISKIP